MTMFIRDLWYVAAWASEVSDRLFSRTLLGEPVLIYREQDGTAVAIGNRCAHRFAPLDLGRRCEDGSIECPYHGLRFDRSGACVHNPHEDGKIPRNARVPAYPLVERYGLLWIWMGDPARADADRIPAFDQLTNPGYRTITGRTGIKAHYELVADNLLDLSHSQFLHAKFARADDVLTVRHEVTQDGDTVFSRRWIPDIPAPNFFARCMPAPKARVDHWVRVRWDAPGLHRLDVGVTSAGRPEEEGMRRQGSHLLTPENETSTHYFYASSRNYLLENENEDEAIREWHRVGFGEQDKPMIEAVQRMMGDHDLMSLKPVLLPVDTAAVRARRVMDALRGLQAAQRAERVV